MIFRSFGVGGRVASSWLPGTLARLRSTLVASLPVLFALAQALPGSVESSAPADALALGEWVLVEAEQREGPDPQATPSAVTVIPVDERLPASADLASLLDAVPGASVQRLGGVGDWSGVSIRGSTLRQVLVALDGVPLNPDGASVVNLAELPLGGFSRIELYRGGAPAEFGAAPVGGVVNLVTGERPPPRAASLALGSFGTARAFGSGGLQGSLGGEPADALVIGELLRTAGDYTVFDDNGTSYNLIDDSLHPRGNNDKLQLNLHARARLGREGLRLTLLDALMVRSEGLAGHVDAPAERARMDTTRNLAAAELDLRRGPVRGKARAWGWGRQEVYDDRAGEIGVGSQWTDEQTAASGLLGSAQFYGYQNLLMSATGSVRRESWRSCDLVTGVEQGPRARRVWGLALGATLWLAGERLALEPRLLGTVLDNRDLDGPAGGESPVEQLDTTLSGRLDPHLGLLWRPAPWLALKANGGTAFRPPDLSELFGDHGSSVGSPELRPERSASADLGLRALLPAAGPVRGSAELTAFATRTEDLIVAVQTGQRVLVPVNLGRTRADGVELGLDLALGGRVESSTALAWTRTENLTEDPELRGKQIPRVPAWNASQSTALVWEGRLAGRLGHTWTFVDGNYWDATNVHRAAPRALHGAFLRLAPGDGALALELDAMNLLDRMVEVVPRNPLDPADPSRVVQALTDMDGYPLPGRSLLFSLRWSPEPEKS